MPTTTGGCSRTPCRGSATRLDAAGLTATNEVYPEAPHGYTMNDTSMYQEAGAERSFRELEALLARTLRG